MTELHTRALELIRDYLNEEFELNETVYTLLYKCISVEYIGLAYTTIGPNYEYPVQVYINLQKLQMQYQVITDDYHTKTIEYRTIEDLIENELEHLCFDDLIGECRKYLEDLLGKEID